MKALLVLAQVCCFLAFLFSTPLKYRLTLLYLCLAIPATLSFQAQSGWLTAWYPWIVAPVALLRLAAGVEIAHRQTEGFKYWSRLMGAVFLLAAFFAGLAWIYSYGGELHSVVVARRLVQIFTGAIFLVLEAFWICLDGRICRRSDWIALWFGLSCFNHATVSVLSGTRIFSPAGWASVQGWSWGIETVCLVGLAFTAGFLTPWRSVRHQP
jgi:hypothetical protein